MTRASNIHRFLAIAILSAVGWGSEALAGSVATPPPPWADTRPRYDDEEQDWSRHANARKLSLDPEDEGAGWISLYLSGSRIAGSYRYHRDYLDDYDRVSLSRALGLEYGQFAGVYFRTQSPSGIGFRAFATAGRFESEPGFEGAEYQLLGEPRRQGTGGGTTLDLARAGLGIDFRVARWNSGRFNLGANLVWIHGDLSADGISEEWDSGILVGTSEIRWVLCKDLLFLDLGFDLGLGIDGGEAGVTTSLALRPARSFQVKIGARSSSAFIDDIGSGDMPQLSGTELAFSMQDLFCELSIRCF